MKPEERIFAEIISRKIVRSEIKGEYFSLIIKLYFISLIINAHLLFKKIDDSLFIYHWISHKWN